MKNLIKIMSVIGLVLFTSTSAFSQTNQKKSNTGSWGGFYLGGNLGLNAANTSMITSTAFTGGITTFTLSPNNVATVAPGYFAQTSVVLVNKAGNQEVKGSGFTAGVQVGYLFQKNKLVAGIEADFNTAPQNETASRRDNYTNVNPAYPFEIKQSIKTDWLMSIRPKIGYATGKAFLYVTGGLAFTNLNYQMNFEDFPPTPPVNAFQIKGTASNNIKETKTGAAFGLGAAINISNNWSIKAEYLNTQFKTDGMTNNAQLATINSSGTSNGSTALPNTIFASDVQLKYNIFRIGFSYRF